MNEFVEDYLLGLGRSVTVIGGSPLFLPPAPLAYRGISINGACEYAGAAAVNSSKSDAKRTSHFRTVIQPTKEGKRSPHPRVIVPRDFYALPSEFPSVQPTTCFLLLRICELIGLDVELYGVCGWASRWHDGDWEMHYIKTRMKNVTVHDPRPRW